MVTHDSLTRLVIAANLRHPQRKSLPPGETRGLCYG